MPSHFDPLDGGDPDARGPSEQLVPVTEAGSEAEQRFRALAEHASDAIAEISAEARFLYVTPSFSEITGWSAGEVLGKVSLEFIHPEDVRGVDTLRLRSMASGQRVMMRFRYRHRDGSWRWMELKGRPYRTGAQEERAVLVIRDVTEQLEAAGMLQRQLEAEACVARIARRFLDAEAESLHASVEACLVDVAELCGAARVQFSVARLGSILRSHYQWCAPGLAPRAPSDPAEAARRFPWISSRLRAGEIVHVPSVASLPAEASAERTRLLQEGTRSYLALPIFREQRVIGFLDVSRNFEEGGWSDLEITRLQLACDVFASAIHRLRAEEENRESEERFQRLTQGVRDTLGEMSLEGRVLWVSPSFETISGYTPEDVAAMEDPWQRIHPDDLALFRAHRAKLFQPSETSPLRYRYLHRDGSWRWFESTFNLFDAPGGERRVAVVSRDVTQAELDRRTLERKLDVEKRVARFSRELLEVGADRIDNGLQHGLEAAAELAGADRAYLVTLPGGLGGAPASYDWNAPNVPPRPHRLGPPEREDHRWISERLERGEIVRLPRISEIPAEGDPVRKLLRERGVLSFLGIPIHSGESMVGVLGFHCLRKEKDWSERELTMLRLVGDLFAGALRRKRAEVELEESQRRLLQAQKMEAVGTLAGGVAHDFNNQLTVMLANARYALAHVPPEGEIAPALTDLYRAAEHCAQLTRSLLAFSRRNPASADSLDIHQLVLEVEGLLRPLIPSSIDFELRLEGGETRVVADATQLQQVLVNLVVNARDAMPDGGKLLLETSTRRVGAQEADRLGLPAAGPCVEFTVRDTGTGMDEAVRRRVFEPFFTTKPVGRGTGLGLATAYGIVQDCAGTIAVESEPGRGSTFRVLLPQSREDQADGAGERRAQPRLGSGTVLIAEDEGGVRRLVARILRAAGYRVLESEDGVAALEQAEAHAGSIDALVTDLDMPRMNGLELVRELTARRPELPVLIISGTAPDPLVGSDAPACHSRFLAKPFAELDFLDTLQELMEGRSD